MEQDDDTIVLIVGDAKVNDVKSSIQEETLVKTDSNSSSLNRPKNTVIINEVILNEVEENFNEEFLSERYRKRYKKLRRCRRSFVKELREQHPELAEDSDLMISTLAEIMRSIKPPPLPQDYYIMNDIMFECMECSALFEKTYEVSRHYQEIHGPKYLICFSCGLNFRRNTNLYAHEKRCRGPDTEVMLRARAISVGNKGRHRPFLDQARKFRHGNFSKSGRELRSKEDN